ncbi:UNVERIFIED_CONTAM: hypothetical protein FKN15_013297 [Acipenser sinensis]
MTSYRAVQNDLMVGPVLGGCMEISGGDYCPPHFRNGNTPQMQHDAGLSRLSGTPSVPKMGVRARIKDWPPRRELSKESLLSSPLHEADQGSQCVRDLAPRSHNGQSPSGDPSSGGFRGLQRIPRGRSKDVEFQDGWPRSPGKRFAPLWTRSNSEITLSEHDTEAPEPARGTKHMATGMPLFREYGSTSSIDVQGISEQSFFEMLNEFRQELPDQRSAAPDKLHELLRADASAANSSLNLSSTASKTDLRNGQPKEEARPLQKTERERARKKSGKSDGSGSTDSSIFRKLLNRGETDTPGKTGFDQEEGRIQEPTCKPWVCPKSFAHYDIQSILFDVLQVAANRDYVAQRRNTTTGASAASAVSLAVTRALGLGGLEPTFMSTEDLNYKENLEPDLGDCQSNDLLLSCPHFRNEIGGAGERNVSFLKSSTGFSGGSEGGFIEPSLNMHCTNASISMLEIPSELQSCRLERLKHYSMEHMDMGAQYYKGYFHSKEHFNYFGTDEKLGPVAISIKREKLEDTKEHKDQYQYRLIFRTSELLTLRGAILEDAVPSTSKHGTVRGLPLKDVLEYVIPELSTPCLRLALNTPKVTEQLLKLDEQGLSKKRKVGILFCKAAQSTEEEMYNNEEASPGFEDFLSLLGEKVCLKGFSKYAAQLDTKTDSTGTHSLYTSYQDYEIMFHVSTMLPYTPNNRQQLLRKRHIGNDIVTIIFQEPDALPFTPQNIRSHFQHVFVIVRVHSPCTENVCYSVAVTRSKDVPPFGPPIPCGVTFRRSDVFRDFLLAKVINAENAAHKSEKFHTMATRTRQEYLKDLAENCVSNTPIDSTGKFNLISLTSKKKEKTRAREGAELGSLAAITWRVSSQDFSRAEEIDCTLGISNEFVVLIDQDTKEVVFNCFCGDVIGWTPDRLAIKIFYGRGDHIFIRVPEDRAEDIREMVQRLKLIDLSFRPVSFPETPYSNTSPGGSDRGQPYRNTSGSFSTPGSGAGVALTRYKQSSDRYGTPQRPLIGYEQHVSHEVMSSGDSSSGFTSQESTMERTKPGTVQAGLHRLMKSTKPGTVQAGLHRLMKRTKPGTVQAGLHRLMKRTKPGTVQAGLHRLMKRTKPGTVQAGLHRLMKRTKPGTVQAGLHRLMKRTKPGTVQAGLHRLMKSTKPGTVQAGLHRLMKRTKPGTVQAGLHRLMKRTKPGTVQAGLHRLMKRTKPGTVQTGLYTLMKRTKPGTVQAGLHRLMKRTKPGTVQAGLHRLMKRTKPGTVQAGLHRLMKSTKPGTVQAGLHRLMKRTKPGTVQAGLHRLMKSTKPGTVQAGLHMLMKRTKPGTVQTGLHSLMKRTKPGTVQAGLHTLMKRTKPGTVQTGLHRLMKRTKPGTVQTGLHRLMKRTKPGTVQAGLHTLMKRTKPGTVQAGLHRLMKRTKPGTEQAGLHTLMKRTKPGTVQAELHTLMKRTKPGTVQAGLHTLMKRTKPGTVQAGLHTLMKRTKPGTVQAGLHRLMKSTKPGTVQAGLHRLMKRTKPGTIQAGLHRLMKRTKPGTVQGGLHTLMRSSKPGTVQAGLHTLMKRTKPGTVQAGLHILMKRTKPGTVQAGLYTLMKSTKPGTVQAGLHRLMKRTKPGTHS